MKFSKMVDYKGQAHFVCKTGRKNVRILEPGLPYEKSFVVPLKQVSNRRPAEFSEDPDVLSELPEGIEDLELIPQ
jgi:hypothetical protein